MVQIQDISSSAIMIQLVLLRVLTVGISLDYAHVSLLSLLSSFYSLLVPSAVLRSVLLVLFVLLLSLIHI